MALNVDSSVPSFFSPACSNLWNKQNINSPFQNLKEILVISLFVHQNENYVTSLAQFPLFRTFSNNNNVLVYAFENITENTFDSETAKYCKQIPFPFFFNLQFTVPLLSCIQFYLYSYMKTEAYKIILIRTFKFIFILQRIC